MNDTYDIIAALCEAPDAGGDFEMHCIHCEAEQHDPTKVLHAPTCPILAGRAWLREHDAARTLGIALDPFDKEARDGTHE